MKQQSLASLTYGGMKKRTKREKFLNEMEQVVPWERLLSLMALANLYQARGALLAAPNWEIS